MDDDSFLEKIHKDHLKAESTIEHLNIQVDNIQKDKKALKFENQTLEKNIEGISFQIMTLEKENVDLNEQIKNYKDKISKMNLQLKTKNVVKVIKGGRIKHGLNNQAKDDSTSNKLKSGGSIHFEEEGSSNNKTMIYASKQNKFNDL